MKTPQKNSDKAGRTSLLTQDDQRRLPSFDRFRNRKNQDEIL